MKALQVALLVVIVGLLFLCPYFFDIMQLRLMTEVLYYALFAISLNLILGYGGMLSFGHAAYFGVGAYATAIGLLHIKGLGLISSVLLGGLVAAVVGAFLSIFLIRVSGTYFAMLTMAFGQLLYAVAFKWRAVTGGDDGLGGFEIPDLVLPFFGKISMLETSNMYWFVLIVVGVMALIAWHITRTPLGSAIVLLRENEERARFLGYRTGAIRFWLFTLSAFFAGVAGGLFALFQEFVSTGAIDILKSIDVILIVVIGGVGQFLGPFVGSLFYVLLGNWLSEAIHYWELILGVLFMVIVLFFRFGLLGGLKMLSALIFRSRRRDAEEVS